MNIGALRLLTFITTLPTILKATECLQCLDANADISSLPTELQLEIQKLAVEFVTPDCANATNISNDNKITLKKCTEDPGYNRVHRCGSLTSTVKITELIFNSEISVDVVIRGCFGVKKDSRKGCSVPDQTVIEEQKTKLEKRFKEKIFLINIGEFTDGQLCLTSGAVERNYFLFLYALFFVCFYL